MRRVVFVFLLVGFWGVSFAQADVPTDHHYRSVVNLLTSKRGFPTRKQMLRTGLGSTTVRILSGIAADTKKRPRLRLNAARALEYFPTRDTEKFLGSVLYGRFWKPAFKSAAMRVMARGFGAKMYFEFLPFLRDSDPHLRAGAALALGDLTDPRVLNNLQNHLSHEKELSVRVAIEKAMDRYRKRERARRQKKEAAQHRSN